jgi:RNA polymerase subunit RPABC4/transcription elongation factor Spt4
MNWKNEKSNLEKLILKEGKSYESIGRLYGCSGTNIKKVSIRLGISLPKRRKINPKETFGKGIHKKPTNICPNCGKEIGFGKVYCDNKCMSEHRHKESYKYFLEHPEKFKRANYQPKSFKKDILEEQDNKCAICGCSPEWNGKPLVFVLDHIDGHASNNSRENLRLICPNCDSQTDTFKSKNKNGERYYYRYHKDKERTQETGDTENPLNDES